VFACPEVERRGVDLVYERYSVSETSEIDSLDVVFAGVASFDADVIELG
jgi:hypothetical protein